MYTSKEKETTPVAELFAKHGYNDVKELSFKVDRTYQQIWNFWTGYCPLGIRLARHIERVTGIPMWEMIEASEQTRRKVFIKNAAL